MMVLSLNTDHFLPLNSRQSPLEMVLFACSSNISMILYRKGARYLSAANSLSNVT